jgi:tetratricopeptide (TPR) repeat protein
MFAGCNEFAAANLDASQKKFEDALAEAKRLRNQEAEYLALIQLGNTYVVRAKYAEAEERFREALKLPESESAWGYIAELYERQGRISDSIAVMKEHYDSKEQDKLARMVFMPKLQKSLKKQWKLDKQHIPFSAYCVTFFRAPRAERTVVGYLTLSEGDEPLDYASLDALNALQIDEKSAAGIKGPFEIEFTFARNTHHTDSAQNTNAKKNALRYREARKLLEVQEKLLGADHIECLLTAKAAASRLEQSGQTELAIQAYQHVLAGLEAKGINGNSLYRTLCALGELYVKSKKYSEAEPLLQRAMKLKGDLYAADAALATNPAPGLAKALTKLNRIAEAKQILAATQK